MGLFDKQNNKKKKGLFDASFSIDSNYDTSKLDNSIRNARLRIESAGYKPSDERNWFEKATNLPKNQNFLMDTLELLGRPGQAVKSGITTESAIGALEGLKGTRKTSGSDVLEHFGVAPDNKYAKGALGFGVDILTDPTMLIPGGVFIKAGKGIGSIAGKGIKALPGAGVAGDALQPTIRGIKETAGSLFNPRHGRDMQFDEAGNLVRGEDIVTPLVRQADASTQYGLSKSMDDIAESAKLAGGYKQGELVGRNVEEPLKQFDEAGNLLPRQKLDFSNDPKIVQAAQNLTESNEIVRNTANELGINLPEMEGYMKHILSKEERKRRKELGESVFNIDSGRFGVGSPSDKFLTQRKYKGSAEEINLQAKRKVFDPNAFFATANGQKQLIEYMHAVDLRRKILSDPRLAIPFKKGETKVVDGTVKVNTKNYNFMKDEDMVELGLADKVGGEYLVPKAVKTALDRYQRLTTDDGINSFLKAYDKTLGTWKKLALFSAGYHTRNVIGNMFNSWVGGMNGASLIKYNTLAAKEVTNALKGKPSKEFDEFLKQGLKQGQSRAEFADADNMEKLLTRELKIKSGTPLEKTAERLKTPFQTSRGVGDFADQVGRYANYKWARDKGMSPQKAADHVRMTQFDYQDLTPFEREVMTRVIPFYRWTRNNLPYQAKQFLNDPRKYAALNHLRLEGHDVTGLDEESTPDWLKEQFAIPISGEGGKGKALGFQVPAGDLGKFGDPSREILGLLSPLIKTPMEVALNRNFFFDSPIERFEGQEKQYDVPFTDESFGVPTKVDYLIKSLTGQPGRYAAQALRSDAEEDPFTTMGKTLGINALTKEFDTDKQLYYQKRDELRKLQDLINLIQQETGSKPATVNELKKQGLFR